MSAIRTYDGWVKEEVVVRTATTASALVRAGGKHRRRGSNPASVRALPAGPPRTPPNRFVATLSAQTDSGQRVWEPEASKYRCELMNGTIEVAKLRPSEGNAPVVGVVQLLDREGNVCKEHPVLMDDLKVFIDKIEANIERRRQAPTRKAAAAIEHEVLGG